MGTRYARFWLFLCLLSTGISQLKAQNSPAPIKLLEFVLTPGAEDWKYSVGQPAVVQVTVLKNDVPLKNVTLSYEAGPEMLPADTKGTVLLKRGQGKIKLGTSQQPGFRQLVVKTEYQGKTYSGQVKVGFSPERIQPTVALPADFLAFWNQANAEAAQVPMAPLLTHLPEHSTATVDVYLVSLQHYRVGQRLYGYLCKPKAPGKYPVLFQPPGAGVKPFSPVTAYAEQGYISFSIEIHGYSPLLSSEEYKTINKAVGNYQTQNLADRNAYYYNTSGCTSGACAP
ncbi:acetylxylan esterase [Hymenobacter norwichensis]|uniref:acetylxylan esterase n=1 Tax=Hymenobacter norwichensis TaxID=223903 RepID=UPI00041DB833|nr:acetylxylan esterase [Hymenobacter norwichensis]